MADPRMREDGGAVSPAMETAMVDAAHKVALVLDPLDNAQRYRVLAAMTVLFGVHRVSEEVDDG